MSEIVIFIDDEETSRTMYSAALQDIYGDEYKVVAIAPETDIPAMTRTLERYERVVSIVIDEKLHVGVGTDYKGSQLVEAIRTTDKKLPLYSLTSEMGLIEPPFGSVEYIIDKSKIEIESYQSQLALLMRRHINSFNEIQNKRTQRFDELLKKSVETGLSAEEQNEYAELDFYRIRQALANEPVVAAGELDERERLLEEIEKQLKDLDQE
jgi:hypothetical protein